MVLIKSAGEKRHVQQIAILYGESSNICNCMPAGKFSTCHRYIRECDLRTLGVGAYTASDKHTAPENGLATQD